MMILNLSGVRGLGAKTVEGLGWTVEGLGNAFAFMMIEFVGG